MDDEKRVLRKSFGSHVHPVDLCSLSSIWNGCHVFVGDATCLVVQLAEPSRKVWSLNFLTGSVACLHFFWKRNDSRTRLVIRLHLIGGAALIIILSPSVSQISC